MNMNDLLTAEHTITGHAVEISTDQQTPPTDSARKLTLEELFVFPILGIQLDRAANEVIFRPATAHPCGPERILSCSLMGAAQVSPGIGRAITC